MRPTLPTFSPTRDHAGLRGRIHNSLLFNEYALRDSNAEPSDPKSQGYSEPLRTTADHGGQRKATGTNRSPLSSPLSHTRRQHGRA
jgi:hypothetical protein